MSVILLLVHRHRARHGRGRCGGRAPGWGRHARPPRGRDAAAGHRRESRLARLRRTHARDLPRAALPDLEWADAIVLGSPRRYGSVTSKLRAFLDTTGGLWAAGTLADKVFRGFTSAQNAHGDQESTLLSLYTTVHHFGGVIVTTGYTEPVTYATGGNPYGPSVTTGPAGHPPTEADLGHACYPGRRVATLAGRLSER